MKSVIQTLAIVSSMALFTLGVLAFSMPLSEVFIKAMAIVGFIAAVLIIVLLECWRRDEEYYKVRLKKKEQRARIRTHI